MLALIAPGTAYAELPDCATVLTDTSRPIAARRELARQCLAAACTAEARELQLAPDATERFMDMCQVDASGQLLADQPASTAAATAVGMPDADCAEVERCADLSAALEATAAGITAAGNASSGHTFVRVQRIEEGSRR